MCCTFALQYISISCTVRLGAIKITSMGILILLTKTQLTGRQLYCKDKTSSSAAIIYSPRLKLKTKMTPWSASLGRKDAGGTQRPVMGEVRRQEQLIQALWGRKRGKRCVAQRLVQCDSSFLLHQASPSAANTRPGPSRSRFIPTRRSMKTSRLTLLLHHCTGEQLPSSLFLPLASLQCFFFSILWPLWLQIKLKNRICYKLNYPT